MILRSPVIPLILHIVLLTFALFYIPVYWDEGWNYCSARQLLEIGHFGCLVNGQPTTTRLAMGWVEILSAALGFKLFGISYVSGRFFNAVQAVLFLISFWFLIRRILSEKIATATLWILLLASGSTKQHPMLLAALGMGELPMALYITLALLLASSAITRPRYTLVFTCLAGFFIALAWHTKLQGRPFISLAFALPIFFIFSKKHRLAALIFPAILAIGWLIFRFVPIHLPYSANIIHAGSGTDDMVDVVAFVLDPYIRYVVLDFVITRFWILCAGLGIASALLLRERDGLSRTSTQFPVVITIFIMASAWLTWFVALSTSFDRYIAPALFFGAPFVALVLERISNGFDLAFSLKHMRQTIAGRHRFTTKIALVFGVTWICAQALVCVRDCVVMLVSNRASNRDLMHLAHYINTETPADTLIESYDAQLFFLLDKKYHYPPDQFHLDAIAYGSNRMRAEAPTYELPLAENLLIVEGIWSRHFGVYSDLKAHGKVMQLGEIGQFHLMRPKN